MKPIDILDALSDLPEEYAAFASQHSTAQTAAGQKAEPQTTRGGIMMKQHTSNAKPSSFRIGRAGIAAAVAVCIGLNAALIFGISRLRKDAGTLTPGSASEMQDLNQPYMEVMEAMPTGILFKITSSAEETLSYNPQYIVMQDGEKVSDCEPSESYFDSISKGEGLQQLCYAQLPSGRYTLVNLAEDGETDGILGHADFEISADFDSMIYIPDVRSMNYDEAKALLEEKGVSVSKKGVVSADPDIKLDDVVFMELPIYKLTEDITTNHFDGKGYWVHPGDPVILQIQTGATGDPATVPYLIGQDFETAKNTLMDLGFVVDKRSAYSDDFPAGTVMEEKVDDKDVPEEGTEATVGTFVRVTVSLGSRQETVIMPDLVGMDWETAKKTAKEAGILLAKQPCEPNGKTPGTVIEQNAVVGEEYRKGSFPVRVYVTNSSDTQEIPMTFRYTEKLSGFWYISVRSAAGETLGNSPVNKIETEDEGEIIPVYAECAEEGAEALAVLVNPDTGKEALIGLYILHPGTASYETISEDIAEAFRQTS